MDWCVQVGDMCLQTLLWLGLMAVVFGVLTRLVPCNPGMHWWQDGWAALTDLLYWLVMPVVVRVVRTFLLAACITMLFAGGEPGFAVVRELPLWAQCVAIMLLKDVMLYWIHRGFHWGFAWRFHAIHHSPRTLDWMSASRFHLINNLFAFALTDVVILLLGFNVAALITLIPFNVVYGAMVHANLNWTFGPLRFIFASPVFHRWHHVKEGEGMNKNFASTFPILDLLFGTYYMPAGEIPQDFGNGEEDFPEDFWGQLIYPFWKKETPNQLEIAYFRRKAKNFRRV